MIPHLARRLRFEQFPMARQCGHTRGPLILQVNQSPDVEPVAGIEERNVLGQGIRSKGRVEKRYVEGRTGRAQKAGGTHLEDAAFGSSAKTNQLLLQSARGSLELFDKHRFPGAPRERL